MPISSFKVYLASSFSKYVAYLSLSKLNTFLKGSTDSRKMGRRALSRKEMNVRFRAPVTFIEKFDEITRSMGHTTRGEAIRNAMQRYMEALQDSQKTFTERVDE
jgi:hypothetical protein